MSIKKASSLSLRLKKLKNAGYIETDDIPIPEKQVKIKLGLISSDEETSVFSYASNWELGKVEYLYRLKQETIAHAIRVLTWEDGSVDDLREVEFIETDEEDSEGNLIQIPRHEFVREIIKTWNETLIDKLYAAHAELTNKMAEKADKIVKLEIPAVRRASEMARSLTRAHEVVMAMVNDPDQPVADIEKSVTALTGSIKILILSALARGGNVETRYDFTPEDRKRDWESLENKLVENTPLPDEKPQNEPQPTPEEEEATAGQNTPEEDELIPVPVPKR